MYSLAQFFRFLIKRFCMVTNIVEAIQQKLGYAPLQKVDANSQEIKGVNKLSPEQKLRQAAVPAVLAAILKYSDGTEGINILKNEQRPWVNTIYSGRQEDVIRKVAEYSGATPETAAHEMERICDEAVNFVRDSIKTPDPEKLRSFMNSQRHNILSHLPAAMKVGDVLNEETFDDRTNKMEGPVSGFLHRIENII